MSTNDELRQRIQRRLSSGALFPAPSTAWAGYGSGRRCAICSSAIEKNEIEYELAGGVNGPVVAHHDCYRIWHAESETGIGP